MQCVTFLSPRIVPLRFIQVVYINNSFLFIVSSILSSVCILNCEKVLGIQENVTLRILYNDVYRQVILLTVL